MQRLEEVEAALGIKPVKNEEVEENYSRIAAEKAAEDKAKAQSNYNALKARLDHLKAMSIPKRRIVKKKKSRKTRSQHAKKVSKSRKTRSDKSAKRGPCKAM